ncbi:DNA-formamidopyrimidine glycosylase [Candidatus Wolfebacteria bacterium]|nr:DNA-formamidopyrimidine glycosylase [Candidatus Wolfebacteria bacterium]
MPELPEVQIIVDDLNKKIIGRRITGVWFDWPKAITLRLTQGYDEPSRIIKRPKPAEFKKQIKGLKIIAIKRRGKNILVYLINPKSKIINLLLIHQKMTGHLLYGKWRIKKVHNSKFIAHSLLKGLFQEKTNGYVHLVFNLDNGWQLALSDLRKFAKILFGTKEEIENLPDLAKIGPEPLDGNFKVEKFIKALWQTRGKRKIKQVLMDQEVVAGIGNIYSDEILWTAKIHPFKPANQLNSGQLKNLYMATKKILRKALRLRGTSISDFRDANGKAGFYAEHMLVYQKEGKPCKRCRTTIKRVKIGGRSARFCPSCQRL